MWLSLLTNKYTYAVIFVASLLGTIAISRLEISDLKKDLFISRSERQSITIDYEAQAAFSENISRELQICISERTRFLEDYLSINEQIQSSETEEVNNNEVLSKESRQIVTAKLSSPIPTPYWLHNNDTTSSIAKAELLPKAQ